MVHSVVWRVGSEDALEFWEDRLAREGIAPTRQPGSLAFADPEGLAHELAVVDTPDEPLVAEHPEIPREHALQGFLGVRAFSSDPERSRRFFEETLEFEPAGEGRWEARGDYRGGFYAFDAPAQGSRGVPGAGTVHHVAWSAPMDEHAAWVERAVAGGAAPSPVIDRFWFRSIYFREPSGVLFEIASIGPGFATDEDPAHLGEQLVLPPAFEHLRERIEPTLTPLPSPRPVAERS
jgi:glyoxalase family protein